MREIALPTKDQTTAQTTSQSIQPVRTGAFGRATWRLIVQELGRIPGSVGLCLKSKLRRLPPRGPDFSPPATFFEAMSKRDMAAFQIAD
jgi:hypothetical protein